MCCCDWHEEFIADLLVISQMGNQLELHVEMLFTCVCASYNEQIVVIELNCSESFLKCKDWEPKSM